MIIHIGYNNFVEADKVIAITSLKTLQARRAREDAISEKRYIDCTSNKITRSLIFLEGGQIVGLISLYMWYNEKQRGGDKYG